jgi:hypothetical protein
MRFLESLEEIQRRFYALRYGEEEARKLVQLHGKDREKHLAMLDEHGNDASKLEAQRELGALFEDSVNAVADTSRAASHIEFARRRDAELKELLTNGADPSSVARYQTELQDVAKTIEMLTPELEELQRISEDKARSYDTASKCFAEKYGEVKLELRVEGRRNPADLPTTVAAWHRRLEKDTIAVFATMLGMPAANRITIAPPGERWLIASECMDVENFEGNPARMMQAREAAVRLISTKTRLMEIHNSLLIKTVVAEEIPAPSDPKEDAFKKQLNAIEQLVASATEAVELAKVVMKWSERETGRRSAATPADGTHS